MGTAKPILQIPQNAGLKRLMAHAKCRLKLPAPAVDSIFKFPGTLRQGLIYTALV